MYFADEIFKMTPGTPITATFEDGTQIDYTSNILDMLMNDPTVKHIIDSETGEILFHK